MNAPGSMVNGERTFRAGRKRSATAARALLLAVVMVLGSSTIAPMPGAASPQAAPSVTLASSPPTAARMLATRQHAAVIIGEYSGHDINTLVSMLNPLNRAVSIEIRLIALGETDPALTLARTLGIREFGLIDARKELGDSFEGAVTISSDRRIAAIVSQAVDGGPSGSAVPYNNAHLGGSSVLTELRHGKGLRTFRGLFNDDDVQVLVRQFLNNSGNQSVGGPVDTLLPPRSNSIQLIGELFPIKPGTKQPAFLASIVADNQNVAAGAIIMDEKTGDTYTSPAIFPHIAGQRIVLPRFANSDGESSTLTVQNHGATAADVHVTRHTGPAQSTRTTFPLDPNELIIIDGFGGNDDITSDFQPWAELHGESLRGAEDAFLSAVVISDQKPAGRSADTDPGVSRVKSGRYHTLVPSWTEEYAANKRAVAMGATLSDSSAVTFYALNVGPKAARVKAVVRNGQGDRVFSKTVTVESNQTASVPFPSRLARRGQVDDLYVDAKISRSGPVFTYLLERRDTGEINYIPGIALK